MTFARLQKNTKSTVLIWNKKQLIGTGVIITSYGLIVTCSHIHRNEKKIYVEINGRKIEANVYKIYTNKDVTVLKCLGFNSLVHADLSDNRNLFVGQNVYVISPSIQQDDYAKDPAPNLLTIATSIAQVLLNKNGDIKHFNLTMPVKSGDSGSGIFDDKGMLIGIISTKMIDGVAAAIPIFFNNINADLIFNLKLLIRYKKKIYYYLQDQDIFKKYISLRCKIKGNGTCSLSNFVINKWLKDNSKQFLAIFGEFGSGKSFFCYRLSHLLTANPDPGTKIPIVIKLSEFKGSNQPTLKQFLLAQISEKLGFHFFDWEALANLLNSGKILLIYDGFEEMSLKASRFHILDNFKEIISTFTPGLKVILTCRTHYFRSEEEEKLLTKSVRPDVVESLLMEYSNPRSVSLIYLLPFRKSDVKKYLTLSTDHWRSIYAKINDPKFYNLTDLAKRPILLNVIAETITELDFTENKITVTSLYHRYVELCFSREYARTGMSSEKQFELMENLAFEAYQEKINYLTVDLMNKVISIQNPHDSFMDSELFIRSYPFFKKEEDNHQNLHFIHQSFFEFFVAKKIASSIEARYHKLYSTEYLTTPIDKYLVELLESSGTLKVIQLWLSKHQDVNVRMNCAVTLGRTGRKEFIEILNNCLLTEKDIGVAGRISEALHSLGSNESLNTFLYNIDKYSEVEIDTGKSESHSLLYDIVQPLENIDSDIVRKIIMNLNHPNPRIRKFAVFILGRIQSPLATESLLLFLRNKHETIRARRYAAAALGYIGDRKSLKVLHSIIKEEKNKYFTAECIKAIKRIKEKRKL
ncbi:MAG: HEAT repeat domain-containing protein [Ignavibacteriales bacterium]|nr:HEAT repeat domain-containing protein [Ignavibacteriales bacterium]